MEPRPLGRSGLRVSPVVLGTMAHRTATRAERIAAIHAALDCGMTSLDTAPLYELGDTETLVGQALRGRRDRAQLLSKIGLRWDAEHGDVLFWFEDAHGQRRAVRRDSRPDAVRRDIEDSLRRLGTDYLDLCQVHHPDPHTPIADTMAALDRLREEGKLLAIGVSNYMPGDIEAAHHALGSVPLASDQLEYNLVHRYPERDILPLAERLDLGILAYSPLAAGLLAGRGRAGAKLADGRRQRPSFHPRNARRVHAVVDSVLMPIARRHQATAAQVALAWLLAQPSVTGVIAGACAMDQVHENQRAAALVLEPAEVARLGDAFGRVVLDPHAGQGPVSRVRTLGRRALGKARRLSERAVLRARAALAK